ncbi:MAG: metal-dependent hydrolase [Planctomycetaceae bacterium]
MSPVGHSLVGLTLATIAGEPKRSRRWKLVTAITFVALASLPDWPLPCWGHDRYDISHSIFVNVGLVTLFLTLWKWIPRINRSVPTRYIAFGITAWLSHLLLDSFYNHGRGVAIFWPFSDGRLKLPIPWFNTLDLSQPILGNHNLSVFVIEFVAYSPLWLVSIILIQRRDASIALKA